MTLLSGALTIMLTARGETRPRSLAMIGAWAAALAAVCGVAGRVGLGTLLTAAFVVQVAPSLGTAYRTARPSGISAGTWTLILGELLCFLVYGRHESGRCWRIYPMAAPERWICVWPRARPPWPTMPGNPGSPGVGSGSSA